MFEVGEMFQSALGTTYEVVEVEVERVEVRVLDSGIAGAYRKYFGGLQFGLTVAEAESLRDSGIAARLLATVGKEER